MINSEMMKLSDGINKLPEADKLFQMMKLSNDINKLPEGDKLFLFIENAIESYSRKLLSKQNPNASKEQLDLAVETYKQKHGLNTCDDLIKNNVELAKFINSLIITIESSLNSVE